MGFMHQLASATLAALFSIAMLFAAHCFTEYRAVRNPAIAAVPPSSSPLQRRPAVARTDVPRGLGDLSVNWDDGAI